MAFQKFDASVALAPKPIIERKKRPASVKFVNYGKSKYLILNAKARDIVPSDLNYCELFFDSDTGSIGVKFVEHKDEFTFNILRTKTATKIAIGIFVRAFRLSLNKEDEYSINFNETDQMFTLTPVAAEIKIAA